MNDYNWEKRDWRALWVSYYAPCPWAQEEPEDAPKDYRTPNSIRTIDDLKRSVGAS